MDGRGREVPIMNARVRELARLYSRNISSTNALANRPTHAPMYCPLDVGTQFCSSSTERSAARTHSTSK
jgi:hypothetical protein